MLALGTPGLVLRVMHLCYVLVRIWIVVGFRSKDIRELPAPDIWQLPFRQPLPARATIALVFGYFPIRLGWLLQLLRKRRPQAVFRPDEKVTWTNCPRRSDLVVLRKTTSRSNRYPYTVSRLFVTSCIRDRKPYRPLLERCLPQSQHLAQQRRPLPQGASDSQIGYGSRIRGIGSCNAYRRRCRRA